jgi:tetratricopeptide (TPR) repeat protein
MESLSKRGPSGWSIAWIGLCAFTAAVGAAGRDAEVADIVARMDYGYYVGDPHMIEAARADLGRVGSNDAGMTYFSAYAAYRLSQLGAGGSYRERHALLEECIDDARSIADDSQWAAEAWILVAACSLQGTVDEPSRNVGHALRLSAALESAGAVAPQNPRLLLIRARAERDRSAGELRERTLELARAGFEEAGHDGRLPTWGLAETLASLGESYLERDALREARDVIEQALLEAPDYTFALELKNALSLPR